VGLFHPTGTRRVRPSEFDRESMGALIRGPGSCAVICLSERSSRHAPEPSNVHRPLRFDPPGPSRTTSPCPTEGVVALTDLDRP
jgi:hypothetical protein